MKKKILNFIEDAIILLPILIILLIGFHMEAVYTMKGTVYSVNGKEITFEDTTGNLFSCYTEDSPNVHKGEKFVLKFDHKGTESDRSDDGLIDFGKHHFLCFVW